MNNKERGEEIRRQIIRAVRYHPSDLTRHIADLYSISPQAVSYHIKKLEKEEWIASTGKGKGKRFFLGDQRNHSVFLYFSDGLQEDKIWRDNFSFIFDGVEENVTDICHYGFTEIVNNAIDHSGGEKLYVGITREKDSIDILVIDDGEGIFKRIKRMCNLADEKEALFELTKGKLTTDPDNHTGQGIFFTSRAFDYFNIESMGLQFRHDNEHPFNKFEETDRIIKNVNTSVYMAIERNSQRELKDVFDEFTAGPTEHEFNKTIVPVRLAQYGDEKLVSRSQAKRVLLSLDKFKNVAFNFEGVPTVGQAFADEIFRVYANNHKDMSLIPINMNPEVKQMVSMAIRSRKKLT